jgi:hypothetical protein
VEEKGQGWDWEEGKCLDVGRGKGEKEYHRMSLVVMYESSFM